METTSLLGSAANSCGDDGVRGTENRATEFIVLGLRGCCCLGFLLRLCGAVRSGEVALLGRDGLCGRSGAVFGRFVQACDWEFAIFFNFLKMNVN